MADFLTLEDINTTNKTVLVRTDLNVPMSGGRVMDNTRIVKLIPTLEYLLKKKCRIILLSHFGRPGGKFVPSLSLAPLVDALSQALGGREIKFGVDCVGSAAKEVVSQLKTGEIVLLENLRFHAEEEKGDKRFARELASVGDVFINDAFSASHRAHASITGIAEFLPVAAGRLMQQELTALDTMFAHAKRPLTAIIGGAKVSTKLELLENLIGKVDTLIIGGAMANTFLAAQGIDIGKSLYESKLKATAKRIIDKAKKKGCALILPCDVVVGEMLETGKPTLMVDSAKIPSGMMALDVGNDTIRDIAQCLGRNTQTVIWNGPLGAFETRPFDVSTMMIAREIAALTRQGKIKSIAGGGDTIAALSAAGLEQSFSYISTGGGAFLEWLEGKTLPGVAVLYGKKNARGRRSYA